MFHQYNHLPIRPSFLSPYFLISLYVDIYMPQCLVNTYTNYLVNMQSKNAVEVEEQNICLRFLFSDIISFCSTIKNDKSERLVIIRSKELTRTHNHTFTSPHLQTHQVKRFVILSFRINTKKQQNSQLSHTGLKLVTTIT